VTARWAHSPYELLEKVSNRIIKEINGISPHLWRFEQATGDD